MAKYWSCGKFWNIDLAGEISPKAVLTPKVAVTGKLDADEKIALHTTLWIRRWSPRGQSEKPARKLEPPPMA